MRVAEVVLIYCPRLNPREICAHQHSIFCPAVAVISLSSPAGRRTDLMTVVALSIVLVTLSRHQPFPIFSMVDFSSVQVVVPVVDPFVPFVKLKNCTTPLANAESHNSKSNHPPASMFLT